MKSAVMVIDDDAFFRKLLKDFLEQNGFQVSVASSWVDFSRAYYGSDISPELILFDVNLGKTMPGDKLLDTFRKSKVRLSSARKTKMVLLSSLAEEELAQKAKECGADGYIQKSTLRVDSGATFMKMLRPFFDHGTETGNES